MMKEEHLDQLFKDLEGRFDTETPDKEHEQRFLDRLNKNSKSTKSTFNWKPFLAIAASLIICLSVVFGTQNNETVTDLASVSPEMSETQDFFTATIQNELKKINKERSPLTEKLIDDAMMQIQWLEDDYKNLKTDLSTSQNDKRIIYAMISNFQNRIDILNAVLQQIETTKQLKNTTNETISTL